MIVAQEKSPPQLSWETTISFSETTRWMYATWPDEPAGPAFARHQAIAPTLGTESVRSGTEVPQYSALPGPDQGRTFGMPLRTIRYAA